MRHAFSWLKFHISTSGGQREIGCLLTFCSKLETMNEYFGFLLDRKESEEGKRDLNMDAKLEILFMDVE